MSRRRPDPNVFWIEELIFAIDVWDADGNKIVERLAKIGNFRMAVAAWDEAIRARPRDRLTLRQGALVLRERKAQERPPPVPLPP